MIIKEAWDSKRTVELQVYDNDDDDDHAIVLFLNNMI